MAGAGQFAGMGKYFVLAVYGILFLEIIIGLVASVGDAIEEKSVKPPIVYLGDKTLGADKGIYDSVTFLIDTQLHEQYPDIYTAEYMEYHRNAILRDLFIIGILVFLFFKVYAWLLGVPQGDNVFKPVFAFILAIVTLAVFEFAYVAIAQNDLIIPLKGLAKLIWNAGNIWSTGLVTAAPSEPILNTVNDSLNATMI